MSPSPLAHDDIERVLIGAAELHSGVERVAAEIHAAYGDAMAGSDELTVLAVLEGSVVFVADLIRCLPMPLRLAFAWSRSYRQGTTGGPLELAFLPPEEEFHGRSVLLVDDILDSGRTLQRIRTELLARGARAVRTCVLLDKPARRAVPIQADHVGFVIEDSFVVGYGLDFAGRYRNLPYVGALAPRVFAVQRESPSSRQNH